MATKYTPQQKKAATILRKATTAVEYRLDKFRNLFHRATFRLIPGGMTRNNGKLFLEKYPNLKGAEAVSDKITALLDSGGYNHDQDNWERTGEIHKIWDKLRSLQSTRIYGKRPNYGDKDLQKDVVEIQSIIMEMNTLMDSLLRPLLREWNSYVPELNRAAREINGSE